MRVLHDPRCLGHEVPPGFPERAERLRAVVAGLSADTRFEVAPPSEPPDDDAVLAAVTRVHDREYVARLERAVRRGDGVVDTADNPISAGSFTAALAGVACALAAAELADRGGEGVFAAVRPPGHHAERAHAMGFCFFNSAAVVAERAIDRGAARVAIVDIDVHHGNGTQHLFEERSDVFYASLHQYPFYPGTGAAGERGRGSGEGFTLNVPLPAGAGDREWVEALVQQVVPAVERVEPELLIVSAGFDAWRGDPLGGMRVTEAGFAAMGRALAGLAARACGGRAVALLEGGYDVSALPRLAAAFLSGEAAEG